jgi:subtilisin family serine protease
MSVSRFLRTFVVSALLFPLIVSIVPAAVGPIEGKLTGELPQVLEQAGPDEMIPVTIVLSDQLTGPRLRAMAAGIGDRDGRRRAVVSALKEHAGRTQVRVRELVEDARLRGRAEDLRYLWIGNIVAASLTPETVLAVAALDVVDHVNWNPKRDVFLGPDASFDPFLAPIDTFGGSSGPFDHFRDPGSVTTDDVITEIECGTDLMQAPRVWNELGNTGEGAVIAVIDSGVCWYHPDIENQIWVNPGEDLDGDGVVMDPDDENGVDDDGNGYIDDLIGYDIDNGDNDPNDNNSHGSHCAGTVAGDGTSGTEAGMAPDAKVMVLRVGLTFADEADVWEAMQYAADNGANSISMSLGWPHGQNPDRATWRQNCDNTIDAGTAMVIAAGNEGSGSEPDNVRTPGDVPRIISVGATDCSDNIASFSSRGPVTWEDVPPWNDHPYPPGLIKPDVSAPGVSTKSHNLCSGYSNKSGTSMATPHVAGAVALMVSANAGLAHDDIKLILEDTSIDLGDPGKDNVFGSGRVDAYEAVLLSQTSDGIMAIREQEVRCEGGTLNLIVSDADLRGAGTVDVEIVSFTETTPEIVTLSETTGDSGVFRGSITTAVGAPASDGVIQVVDGDTVTATYVDADDGEGGINVPKTDTAGTDCSGPTIDSVRATDITDVRATIRWTTDEPANSRVTYGEGTPPDIERSSAGLVGSHAVTLTGLRECTIYYYQVASADAYGNDTVDDNGGQYYYFETWGDFGQGLQPCHAGVVSLDRLEYACEDAMTPTLVDIDLNLSAAEVDTATVTLSSTTETTPEETVLVETGPNTSTFTGTMPVSAGSPATADGVLQVGPGDVLTATYHDADNGTGSPAVSFATSVADCVGPTATIRVFNHTDETAQVEIVTAEPSTVTVDWGETAALGRQVSDPNLATSHTLTLEPLTECGRFHFRVRAVDVFGNESTFDASGAPFEANAGHIPGAIFKDEFETGTGWSLDGEWEIGETQGLGSAPGDPAAAYAGARVLGHDLSGQGEWPGDYEQGSDESAVTPVIDASALGNAELKFRRMLNVGNSGIAYLQVESGGAWNTIWTSPSAGGFSESDWTLVSYDISQFGDGNGSLRVRFRQTSGFQQSHDAGWNIDRFIIRDGSLPDFGVCENCAGSAGFGGVLSAVDADACAAGGVTLSWIEPPSWGTGGSGTYVVYRDTVPGFTPGPANRVASGIAGTTWTDPSSPTDTTLYYVVRTETDETCSTGPNNGGVVDDNLVQASVVDETAQPLPGSIGESLRVTPINAAHVRLTWSAAVDAATYHVYRATSPDGPFTLVGDVAETLFDDVDQMAAGASAYYEVRAADACGNEM